MVARDGVEPPTPAFSVQQLNFAEWPIYCDHSVTSADVRLSVGLKAKYRVVDVEEPFVVEVAAVPDYFLFAQDPGVSAIDSHKLTSRY
jgi:hypothetical protein